ncbi:hypothetical protein TNCV_4478451 [Trichonephila clavipes]|nr:hypothetical protein TNCV_4478451 [Trichonephila clavipes]
MKGIFVLNVSTLRVHGSNHKFVFGRENRKRFFATRRRAFFPNNFRPRGFRIQIFARKPRSLHDGRFGTSRLSVEVSVHFLRWKTGKRTSRVFGAFFGNNFRRYEVKRK